MQSLDTPQAIAEPLAQPRSKSRLPRIILSLLVVIALPALGLGIAVLKAHWSLQQQAREATHKAITTLDHMIANGDAASLAVENLAGQPCDYSVERALQRQVAIVPYVRSVHLLQHNRLYCSSLLGKIDEEDDTGSDGAARLQLKEGNITTPDVPILIVRRTTNEGSALAVVDGRYLHTALQLAAKNSELFIIVGNNYMDKRGHVGHGSTPPLELAQSTLASKQFPYMVIAGSPSGSVKRYLLDYDLALLSLLIGAGFVCGLACYRLLGRPSSPRAQLQRALEAGEFEPFLQPIVATEDGRWIGAEVLMRWRLPGEGLIRPDLFIPMAEQTGLILPMTRDLMRQLAKALAPHMAELPSAFHLSINISAAHCHDPQLLDDCREFLAAFQPGQIELWLELTERELIEPTEQTDALFKQLDAEGIKIAIDDFGIGHASLNYLQRFTVDALKIDQSFVARIGADTLSGHLLDTLVELAERLEIDLIAEGVETAEQRDYLQALHVRYLQGYYFGRPMPMSEFIHALRNKRPADIDVATEIQP
ncbi:cyclic diguanylate phosphodiesterase [Jeongeupia sp. HS-3]|nr:cyclic diguanylate phosphodiesterase [Jeongeupia sp. HS-3]